MSTKPNAAATELVGENLGLTADDLGMDRAADSFITDTDDEPEDTGEGDVEEKGRPSPDNEDGDADFLRPDSESRESQPREPERTVVDPDRPATGASEFMQRAGVRADAKGNLFDAKGRMVARSGREARYYREAFWAKEGRRDAVNQFNDVRGRLERAVTLGREIHGELENYRQREKTITDMGITPQEQMQAFQYIVQGKTDPISALKGILTLAASNGIDLQQLGLPGNAIDPNAFRNIVSDQIQTALKPVTEDHAQRRQQEQQQRETIEANNALYARTQQFFNQFPEAKQYADVFIKAYEQPQFQNMSLPEMWLSIQRNLSRTGQRPTSPNGGRRPIPNSRPMRSGPTDGGRTNGMAPVTDSFESIARGVLKDLA